MTERCYHCGEKLGREIHVFNGRLYCSKYCAIANTGRPFDEVEEKYSQEAEVISPSEAGIEAEYTVKVSFYLLVEAGSEEEAIEVARTAKNTVDLRYAAVDMEVEDE